MIVILAESFGGVEMVFRKRESTRSDRSPRINKPEKDPIERAAGATDETSPLALDRFHVGTVVEIARASAIAAHKLKHQRIQLDRRYLAAARRKCRDYISAAAGTDHQRMAIRSQLERKRAIRVAQVARA